MHICAMLISLSLLKMDTKLSHNTRGCKQANDLLPVIIAEKAWKCTTVNTSAQPETNVKAASTITVSRIVGFCCRGCCCSDDGGDAGCCATACASPSSSLSGTTAQETNDDCDDGIADDDEKFPPHPSSSSSSSLRLSPQLLMLLLLSVVVVLSLRRFGDGCGARVAFNQSNLMAASPGGI